jgi:hypothetical protein
LDRTNLERGTEMLTAVALYGVLGLFFMLVAVIACVGLYAVVAVLDHEWEHDYVPQHRARKPRYVGQHRAFA